MVNRLINIQKNISNFGPIFQILGRKYNGEKSDGERVSQKKDSMDR